MKILEFPIRNYQFTVILFAMLAALGLSSWSAIPRGEDPPLDFPTYTVVAVLPGASPKDLERLVIREVEERLDALEKVDRITSLVKDGVATVVVEFEETEDPEKRYEEVLREMNALRPELPAELVRFSVEKATTLNVAIAQLALVSEDAPYSELDRLSEALEDRLSAVAGVRTVDRWGVPERRVEVTLDLGRLARLEVPPSQVLQAIGSESADLPAGTVEAGARSFNVRGSGSYETLEQIRSTVVRSADGQLLTVGDLGEVTWGYADSTYQARHNGTRAVFVTVTQQDGQNIAAVRDRIWDALDAFEQGYLPDGVRLERGFDQSANVSHRLSRLGEDFLIAIGLVLVTLLPLGLRAAGIVMIAIPLSLAMGVSLLYFTGFTINQLSIVGAVIALGLLVDDSIVVVENITRFLREGRTRTEAAIEATRQIAVAVIGSTATLVFAFVPLLFLPGGAGMYIRSLPLAVVYTVVASLLVSLTIIPWLASRVLRQSEPEGGNRVLQLFERVIHRTYAPVLERALRRPGLALGATAVFVVAVLALIPAVGFSLFPKAETPQFYVNVTSANGASLEATEQAARFAEGVLLERPEIRSVFTSVGRDNPTVYYNIFPRRENPAVGQLFVVMDEYSPGRTPALLDSLRTRLAAYPGARLELREFENGPPIDAPIALRVQGPSLDTLRTIAAEVEQVLTATPGTQYVNNPLRLQRTDLRVEVDREKAGLLGIPTVEVDRMLRLGLEGLQAGVLREPSGDARPVVVRLDREHRAQPTDLDRIHVASLAGLLTPLRQIADVRFEADVPEIQRVDRERSVTVTSFVRTGFVTDRVTRGALEQLESLALPAGYRLVAAGEIESREESFGGVGSAIIVATFAILAILVLEFGTFRSTLIVASVIPLGAVGGILALFLVGQTLSFTATIGFVALIGIEIKTSILLVDLTNQLRREGMDLEEAIRRAGEIRFLPILLTAMTAIGGLLPLALQGQGLYAPLAWVIIGGLITSTLLGRVLTPVLYKLLPPALDVAAQRA
ncbi:MAG: efflux RND transporter permease subunit [Gemmatimonadota bacterium]